MAALDLFHTWTLAEVRERLDSPREPSTSVSPTDPHAPPLSFAYEYNRVSSTTSLVQVLLSEANLKALHADLAGSRTESLVAKVGQPGITVETYLNEKEVTRTQSWGFTLGFGKWATLGGKDLKKVTTVRRTDIDGRVQDAYQGARSYEGTWIGETFRWGVDFKADMKEFAREPLVTTSSSPSTCTGWTTKELSHDSSSGLTARWVDMSDSGTSISSTSGRAGAALVTRRPSRFRW